ncbi:MAG: hypothetical protein LHV69_10770 [Elusimicrobia bacterium]|nr:hypothetical protein [Candidatus Obscuribacterium magneticum]
MSKVKKKGKVKVRRLWKIHPATRIERDRKKYDRKRLTREFKRETQEGRGI